MQRLKSKHNVPLAEGERYGNLGSKQNSPSRLKTTFNKISAHTQLEAREQAQTFPSQ